MQGMLSFDDFCLGEENRKFYRVFKIGHSIGEIM